MPAAVLRCIGKELDAEPCVGGRVQCAGYDQLSAALVACAAEHRIVLQVVGAAVCVARVVDGDTVVLKVDAETAVVAHGVAQHRVAGAAAHHGHPSRQIVGNQVAGAGDKAADQVVACPRCDPYASAVAEAAVAAAVGADEVAGDDVAVGADAIELDAGPLVAANDVARAGDVAADGVARRSGIDQDTLVGIGYDLGLRRVQANDVALHRVGRDAGTGEGNPVVGIARQQVARAGSRAADGVVVSAVVRADAIAFAVAAVGDDGRARLVGADVVAGDDIARGGVAIQDDALEVIA